MLWILLLNSSVLCCVHLHFFPWNRIDLISHGSHNPGYPRMTKEESMRRRNHRLSKDIGRKGDCYRICMSYALWFLGQTDNIWFQTGLDSGETGITHGLASLYQVWLTHLLSSLLCEKSRIFQRLKVGFRLFTYLHFMETINIALYWEKNIRHLFNRVQLIEHVAIKSTHVSPTQLPCFRFWDLFESSLLVKRLANIHICYLWNEAMMSHRRNTPLGYNSKYCFCLKLPEGPFCTDETPPVAGGGQFMTLMDRRNGDNVQILQPVRKTEDWLPSFSYISD